jgi:hypothetical protein
MLRKTFLFSGLLLAALAFVLDGSATNAEACGGCRGGCGGGCGYSGGCGGGYGYGGGYGGGCCARRRCCSSCSTCCYTPVYVAPTCCAYGYPGTMYAPAYVNAPRTQYYASPALPVANYGMPVAMPNGSVLVSYRR